MDLQAVTFLPPNLPLLQFLLLGGAAAMLVSAAKAGFGGDVGLLAVPLMIFACNNDAAYALGLMLPLLIACDYFALLSWWRQWNGHSVLLLLPGALVGIAAAWLALWLLQRAGAGIPRGSLDAVLKLAVGVISLMFVTIQLYRMVRKEKPFRPDLRHGSGFGAAAGLTSTFAHAAGPVISMYMLPQEMPKGRYVASTVFFFWICNQLKLAPYLHLGMIDGNSFLTALLLMPAAVIGVVLGLALHKRVGQKYFVAVVYLLLTGAAIHLIVQAVSKLA